MIRLLALIGAVALLTAGLGVPAKALDSSFEGMSRTGEHHFYVWCTGKADYEATSTGRDARDAQAKLAARAGNRCWPVWQGRKEES